MRNLIVLGSGRSGTSAVAGLFRNVPDIFYGYDVLAPTVSNPRGYYEDEVVNTINNVLIRQLTGTLLLDLVPEKWLPWVAGRFSWIHRDSRSLWLARPSRPLRWRLGYDMAHLMGRIASHQPFCLKDPRFCFTLPLWVPYLPDEVRFLVVFRDPGRSVASMLRDATALYGARPLALTEDWAVAHWKLAYERILDYQRTFDVPSNWLFVDCDDVVSGVALSAIETFADCRLDGGQLDSLLLNTNPSDRSGAPWQSCAALYQELREIAGATSKTQSNGPHPS